MRRSGPHLEPLRQMAGSFEVGVLSGKILLGDFVTIALANPRTERAWRTGVRTARIRALGTV